MVREGLIGSNKHKNEWCCAEETSNEVYRYKTHSALDNTSPNFAWYGKCPLFMNYDHLDVPCAQLHHHLKIYKNENNKYHSWVIPTAHQK